MNAILSSLEEMLDIVVVVAVVMEIYCDQIVIQTHNLLHQQMLYQYTIYQKLQCMPKIRTS